MAEITILLKDNNKILKEIKISEELSISELWNDFKEFKTDFVTQDCNVLNINNLKYRNDKIKDIIPNFTRSKN